MDWKLTKSLYILVFLLINVALLMMYYNKQQEDIREIENSPGVLEETNIDLTQLPEHQPEKLNILAGEKVDFNEVEEVSEASVEIINDGYIIQEDFEAGSGTLEMTAESLRRHKEEQVYRGGNYQYDDIMSNDNAMLFNQYYGDYPIFNNEAARLIYRGNGTEAIEYEQGYITNLRENSLTSPIAVRNPRQVVSDLYMRQRISEEAVIENARLGYYIILSDDDQVLLRPKWELQITDQGVEKAIYVDAISETEDIIESE
ncbi:two-component system regulatory protein YycI [Salinicoccus luteus]|uniref:two-component system regulatory protein YycI n=1 Tax=Salinicoccus luteus TaxID=367840 RepID=UPI0004E23829|nr:two-component system regulatory protein YycI [Salinicoccus luteus]